MKIVFIDDHKLILEGYKAILVAKKLFSENDIILLSSLNESYEFVIEQTKTNNTIDLFLVDYSMPASSKHQLKNGYDLIIHIKEKFPSSKFVLLTSEMSPILLFDIIQKTKPRGFWFKSDIDHELLINYISAVCDGEVILSENVEKSYNTVLKYSKVLDGTNLKILLYLSQGIKTKDLPNYIPLSLDTINHRKASIKSTLGVDSKDDFILLEKAKSFGLL